MCILVLLCNQWIYHNYSVVKTSRIFSKMLISTVLFYKYMYVLQSDKTTRIIASLKCMSAKISESIINCTFGKSLT